MKRSGRKLQRISNITMILSNVKKTRKKKSAKYYNKK